MNWGAFLGGATKSYLDTTDKLESQKLARLQRERIERQVKDEEGFRAAQTKYSTPEYEGGTAIPTIVDQGFGSYDDQQKGQLKTALGGMTPEQQQTALRSYGQSDPAMDLSKIGVYQNPEGKVLGTNEYTERTASEQQSQVLKQMQKDGNIYGIEKSLGLKKGLRENDMNDKWDAFSKTLTEDLSLIETTIQKDGFKGIPAALNPKIKAEGLVSEYVDGKTGGAIVLKNIKTGKVVGKPYTTAEQISKAVSGAEFDVFGREMMQFFNSPADMVNWAKARTEIRQKDRQLGIQERDAASSAAFRQAVVAETARNNDLTHQYRINTLNKPTTATQGVRELAESMFMGTTNPNTGQPYTLKEAEKAARAVQNSVALQDKRRDFVLELTKLNLNPAEVAAIVDKEFGTTTLTQTEQKTANNPNVAKEFDGKGEGDVSNNVAPQTAIPTYTPPKGSPAGNAAANRENSLVARAKLEAEAKARTAEMDKKVLEKLPSITIEEAAELQQSKEFKFLSPEVQAQVRKKVFGK